MEPLNKKERTSGTLKFLALFIAGILIVMIPFFFLVRLPEKTQQVSSDELNSLQGQLAFQREFAVLMDSAIRMMERYDQAGVDTDILNASVGNLLNDINLKAASVGKEDARLYNSAFNALTELKKVKTTNLKNKADLAKALKELEECQADLKKATSKPSDSLDH
ncbi:MAG: type VI secretion system TssO [Bacteroidales bacterium]